MKEHIIKQQIKKIQQKRLNLKEEIKENSSLVQETMDRLISCVEGILKENVENPKFCILINKNKIIEPHEIHRLFSEVVFVYEGSGYFDITYKESGISRDFTKIRVNFSEFISGIFHLIFKVENYGNNWRIVTHDEFSHNRIVTHGEFSHKLKNPIDSTSAINGDFLDRLDVLKAAIEKEYMAVKNLSWIFTIQDTCYEFSYGDSISFEMYLVHSDTEDQNRIEYPYNYSFGLQHEIQNSDYTKLSKSISLFYEGFESGSGAEYSYYRFSDKNSQLYHLTDGGYFYRVGKEEDKLPYGSKYLCVYKMWANENKKFSTTQEVENVLFDNDGNWKSRIPPAKKVQPLIQQETGLKPEFTNEIETKLKQIFKYHG